MRAGRIPELPFPGIPGIVSTPTTPHLLPYQGSHPQNPSQVHFPPKPAPTLCPEEGVLTWYL